MTIFQSGYYKINRVSLSLCGIWPEQNLFQAYIARFVMWSGIASILIPEYFYLYNACIYGSFMEDVIPCIPSQLFVIIVAIKYCIIAYYLNTFKNRIDRIAEDWQLFGSTFTSLIMHEYAERGKMRTKIYGYVLLIIVVAFLALPMMPVLLDIFIPLNETRTRLPLLDTDYSIYGFEQNDHFFLITIHAYITSVFLAFILWSIDSFIMIIVQHCCGLFGIVGFVMKKLNSDDEKYSKKFENYIIHYAIDVHLRALSFADVIETSFKNMYGIVLILNTIIISLTGVETIMKLEKTDQAIRFAAFTFGQIVHLFFNSLPGQELFDCSTNVFDEIYDSNWHSISVKGKKSILMILMRSQIPSRMTAGGFYELNMEHFSQIVKTSMSYLMVLLSMR